MLENWGNTWGMRFNDAKCNIMRVSRTLDPKLFNYSLTEQVLEEVMDAKYLGVTLGNDLEWSKHIAIMTNKANSKLSVLRRNLKGCPITGLVKTKPNPPMPPRAEYIHISHTPPTPLIPCTKLIHNTSAALGTIPEPRVPPTCPALTTPHPSPTPALSSTSYHHTLSADTHATQTTVHASQSHPQNPTDPKNTRCMPNMSTNINAPRQIMPLCTMVYCFYVHILGIILLCLWLYSVYFILCLSIAVMFLVCGVVSACMFSACRHASLKLRRIVITRMSPSCSINNNNRVAKLYETLYLIYKKEQYRSSIYSKMIKYLKLKH